MYIHVYSSELHEMGPVIGFECEAASQVALELRRQGLDQRSIHCLLPLDVLLWELLHMAQCVVRDSLCGLAGLSTADKVLQQSLCSCSELTQ